MNDIQMGQLIESVKQLVKNQDKHDIIHEKINVSLDLLNNRMIADNAIREQQQQDNVKREKTLKISVSVIVAVISLIGIVIQKVI